MEKISKKLTANVLQILKGKIKELQKEKKFSETVLATMPQGLDIVDNEGNIIFMNKKFLKLFGEKSIGKKCWEVYKDNKKQCDHCPLKRSISLKKTKIIESDGIAGGNIFSISHTGILLPDGSKGILEVFNDITELKRMEKELKKSK